MSTAMLKRPKCSPKSLIATVRATKSLTKHIDGNVKATKELIYCNVKAAKTLTESIGHNVRAIDKDLKATKHQTHDLKRNQLRREFRTWLLPPDPSINHNTACEIQHPGTAKWFIQGSTFRDWKKNGSLLWIRGNRTPFPLFLLNSSSHP
ncbi:hypothetical protein F5148DRAFT_422008 [Russula earlei]|uniref:Uncharacterized protein n=1 Tax=Russula earlei TaxID=71964 RepID=A0ACC0UH90_9AGAM|nr:hypothetical protein F5148DRAFT_422008 [Russula earlei]